MKSIFAALMLSAVVALGQTNLTTLTAAEREAAAAKLKADMERMQAELQKSVEAAQARARLREAMLATGAMPKYTNWSAPLIRATPPWFNTNAASPTLGAHLLTLEEHFPGISTNYTAEQRAFNTNRPIIRATRDKDGKIIFLSTNYVDPVTGKLSTNKPASK